MTIYNEPHILIIDHSIAESTALTLLLSPLSKNIVACTSYTQGLEYLSTLHDKNPHLGLTFLALPPSHHQDFDTAIKIFALALQNGHPARTIILGGDNIPPELGKIDTKDNSIMHKPITREKLAGALAPLYLSLPKTNCWEYMGCGREPGGKNAAQKGVCPTATEKATEGLHSGTCGGRACWAISGTMCGGSQQGTFASKIANCQNCDFYQLVRLEEGPRFESINSILRRLKRRQTK